MKIALLWLAFSVIVAINSVTFGAYVRESKIFDRYYEVKADYCRSKYKQGTTYLAFDGANYTCFDRHPDYPNRIQMYQIVFPGENK